MEKEQPMTLDDRQRQALHVLTVYVADMSLYLVAQHFIGADRRDEIVSALIGDVARATDIRKGLLLVRMYLEANLYNTANEGLQSLATILGFPELLDLDRPIERDDFYYNVLDRYPRAPASN